MKKKLFLLAVLIASLVSNAQSITFTFENARITNDGVDDFYEADIYIESDADFKLGSGLLFFNYNTAAFGESVFTNGNFEYLQPTGSILAQAFGFPAYTSFITNDNTPSRVAVSFQQGVSSGTMTSENVTSTAAHLLSIKIRYTDSSEDPGVSLEQDDERLVAQFFTACGPETAGFADCINSPGVQITEETFDSSGASLGGSVIAWSGATSSDWNTATNWVGDKVPTATDDVEIGSATISPVVDNEIIEVNNLNITTGGSLSIITVGAVNVAGDLTVVGDLVMTGSSISSTTAASLIVEGTTTGSITYQLEDFTADEFTLISAPVSGQVRSEFMQSSLNDILINTTPDPDRYALATYNDANADGAKWEYFDADDLSDTTSEFGIGAGYSFAKASAGTIVFNGIPIITAVDKAVTASEFNLIGNPYTAFYPINENGGSNFISDNADVMDASFIGVYTWDTTEQKYVATTLTSDITSIAPGKGFFVHTGAGASTLSFDATKRSESPEFSALRSVSAFPEIQLTATANGVGVKTYVKYLENSTAGLDPGYDVGNFSGATFDIYTKLLDNSSDVDFTIQALASTNFEDVQIPLGIVAKADTEIEFSAALINLPSDVNVFLEDVVNNTFTNLATGNVKVTMTEDTKGTGQFYLHTSAKSLSTEGFSELSNLTVYTSGSKQVTISGISSASKMSVYGITGQLVFEGDLKANISNKVDLSKASSGVYLVKVVSENAEMNKKIILK